MSVGIAPAVERLNNEPCESAVMHAHTIDGNPMPDQEEAPINIRIVDDEPRNLVVLETILDDPSYRLVRATSAEQALLALIADEFALLILDIHMPDMSGFELAHMIKKRKRTAHVPVIFLTAYYTEDQHVIEGYGAGAVDYLHKPVNSTILRSKVSVFAELHRKSRQIEQSNSALLSEIKSRRRAEEKLSELNATLEKRVADRTEALRDREEQFRQLADSMPQMVWTAAQNGRFDYYNARWYAFTGFVSTEDGDLAAWKSILHPDDLARCYDTWAASIQSGEEYRIEYRLWDRHTRRYSWYLGRALPVRQKGSIVKWIGTCTDIDEQKRIEGDLRRANSSLEQFAFAASHDLQEPLRNVVIYTQLLRQQFGNILNEEAHKLLEIIIEGALRVSRLVSDLLEYTRIASSGDESPEEVDAKKIYEKVLTNLALAVQSSEAVVTRSELPSVFIRDLHLEQLLQNLIGNAIKYTKDGEPPMVHVYSLSQNSGWHFAVRDNGIGIAPEYHTEIFGVFKRLHVRGNKYPGTGIGLAICEKIVDRYGGRIWVESEPGLGATFHFTIPASV